MATQTIPRRNSDLNKISPEDRHAHDWYRFVLSFPPHLVADYLAKFDLSPGKTVLDPFCGTGTTLVESKKRGISSIGIEANRMAHFATTVKLDWSPDPSKLFDAAKQIAATADQYLSLAGIDSLFSEKSRQLDVEAEKLFLTNSISPVPLEKCLLLKHLIETTPEQQVSSHFRLALASTAVFCASNLKFGPEIGVGARKQDAPVFEYWLEKVQSMASDLALLADRADIPSQVILGDSRSNFDLIAGKSIDCVFTSPPYPNEKDYTRTTRLESVLLDFVSNKAELQSMKRTLLRSNTRNVYKGDEDDQWIAAFPEIIDLADQIEARRIELGKSSGFERMYARVTKLYFGGMARHLAEMRRVLKPGAMLGYVVGDQASYLRVMIRTGELLGKIAVSLGYELVRIDLFRTRLATATREQLREEVVVLRWPGS